MKKFIVIMSSIILICVGLVVMGVLSVINSIGVGDIGSTLMFIGFTLVVGVFTFERIVMFIGTIRNVKKRKEQMEKMKEEIHQRMNQFFEQLKMEMEV